MKSLELFAGIGGIALAAEWAGIETIAFCEREPFCQKVLNKHWPQTPIFDDIRTLNKEALIERGVDVGTIELITGGFPCQPYSVAGKRRGTEDDRDLWPEMFRIITEIRPTWIVGENVANFAKMELDRTLSDLESIGYETRSFVFPASAVQAPHERMRTFIVANSQRLGCEKRSSFKEGNGIRGSHDQFDHSSKTLADSTSVRLPRQREYIESLYTEKDGKRKASEPINVRIGEKWPIEPNVGRVANGIPKRVDRIRGLGNAVVPAQIYPIFEAIVQIESEMEESE